MSLDLAVGKVFGHPRSGYTGCADIHRLLALDVDSGELARGSRNACETFRFTGDAPPTR